MDINQTEWKEINFTGVKRPWLFRLESGMRLMLQEGRNLDHVI